MTVKKARTIFNHGLHLSTYTRDRWISRATADLYDQDREDQTREKIWNNIKQNPKNPRLTITEDFVNALFDGYAESTSPNLDSIEDIKKIFIWIQHSPELRNWFNAIVHNEKWDPVRTGVSFSEDFDADELKLSQETLRKLANDHKELLKIYAPKVFADRANMLFSEEEINLKESEEELVEIFSCQGAHPDMEVTFEILETLLNRKKHNLQLEMHITTNSLWVNMLLECEWITKKSYPYLFAARELQGTINESEKSAKDVLVEQINTENFDELEAYFMVQYYWTKISPYAQIGIIKSFFHFISFGFLFSKAYSKAATLLTNKSRIFEAKLSYQSSKEKKKRDASFNSFLVEYLKAHCSEELEEKKNTLRSVVLGIVDPVVRTEIFGDSKVNSFQGDQSGASETYIKSLAATYSESYHEDQENIDAILKEYRDNPAHFQDAEQIDNDDILHIVHMSIRSGLSSDELGLVNTFKQTCVNNNLMLLRVISLAKDSRRILVYLRSMNLLVSALIKELPGLQNLINMEDIRTLFRLKNKEIIQTVFKEKRLADLVIKLASDFGFEKAAYKILFELFTRDAALHLLTHKNSYQLCLHLHATKLLFSDFEQSKPIIFNLWKKAFAVSASDVKTKSLSSSTETAGSGEAEDEDVVENKFQQLFSAVDWRDLLLLIEYCEEEQDHNIYHLPDNFQVPMLTLIKRKIDDSLPNNIFLFIHPLWFTKIFSTLDIEGQFSLLTLMLGADFQRFFDGDRNIDNRNLLSDLMHHREKFADFLTHLSDSYSEDGEDNLLISLLSDKQLKLPLNFHGIVSKILTKHSDELEFADILNENPKIKEMIEESKAESCSL